MKLCNIMYYKNCLCLSRKYNKYICFLHQRKSVISKILNKPVESLTDMDIFRNYGGCKRTQLSHVRE
jgi:hypothetical protein